MMGESAPALFYCNQRGRAFFYGLEIAFFVSSRHGRCEVFPEELPAAI